MKKYLENPKKRQVKPVGRPSKLDPYRDLIQQMLGKDPQTGLSSNGLATFCRTGL
jgi:hypothetical protein